MKYKLSLNKKQAEIISFALDFYARTMGGQFEDIIYKFDWRNIKSEEERDRAFDLFRELKCMLTGLKQNQPNIGLGNICEDGKIAYDLHQVIRHRIATDHPNDYGEFCVDFNKPRQVSNEPLAKIDDIDK